jgi:hypothetical protein
MAQTQPLRSRFVNGGCPTRCHTCSEPFKMFAANGSIHIEAHRQGDYYFCSTDCAEACDEPAPQRRSN